MGLTDMAKHVSGSDASLSREADDPAGLTRKINIFKPSTLAFVGKRAGQVWLRHQFDLKNPGYGLQPVSHDATAIFILPSTSGAANGFWDPLPWYDLAAHIRLIEKESL